MNHYRTGWDREVWDTLAYQGDSLILIKGMFQERYNSPDGGEWMKRTYYKRIDNEIRSVKVDSVYRIRG